MISVELFRPDEIELYTSSYGNMKDKNQSRSSSSFQILRQSKEFLQRESQKIFENHSKKQDYTNYTS